MSKNIKIGNNTLTGVSTIKLEDANTSGTYDSFVDTTDADATADNIISTKTAYVNGTKLTGTFGVGSITEALNMANGNQVITATSGDTINAYDQVTITKPATLIAENIKKDVVIGGVTGTFEGGAELEIYKGGFLGRGTRHYYSGASGYSNCVRWKAAGTKVNTCYVFCKLDVTDCQVYVDGRQMIEGEMVTCLADCFLMLNSALVHPVPRDKTLISYYGSWGSFFSASCMYWYLKNNTLYLLNYYDSIYFQVSSSGTNDYKLIFTGIDIVGTPSLTQGTYTISTTTVTDRTTTLWLDVHYSTSSSNNVGTVLPSGLNGHTIYKGVYVATVSGTQFELLSCTITSQ